MDTSSSTKFQYARTLVKAAAKGCKIHSAKVWLQDDPRGFWEKRAADLVSYLQEKHPEAPESQVAESIVLKLQLEALEAEIARQKS